MNLLSVVTSANDLQWHEWNWHIANKNNRLQFAATPKDKHFRFYRLNTEHIEHSIFLKKKTVKWTTGCLRAAGTRSFQFHEYLYFIWFFFVHVQMPSNFEIEMFVISKTPIKLLLTIIIHFAFGISIFKPKVENDRETTKKALSWSSETRWTYEPYTSKLVEIDTFCYYRLPTLAYAHIQKYDNG